MTCVQGLLSKVKAMAFSAGLSGFGGASARAATVRAARARSKNAVPQAFMCTPRVFRRDLRDLFLGSAGLQHLVRRQEAVAVLIHRQEAGDGLASRLPLVQADLPVAVGVILPKPGRQAGRQVGRGGARRRLLAL